MKHANLLVLVLGIVWIAGCASAPREVAVAPIGPAPGQVTQQNGDGSLVIYSARARANPDVNTQEWLWNNDYGRNAFRYAPAHTAYTIYALDGKVLKQVPNARGPDDEMPTVVMLPAGAYRVKAEAIDSGGNRVEVLVPVVIKPGQTTLAYLEGGWKPKGTHTETELTRLPWGQPIGWRASEQGFASSP